MALAYWHALSTTNSEISNVVYYKEHKQFRVLENDSDLFHSVRADTGGYGVVWNDELDLSCDELFLSGKTVLAESGSADAALPGDETGLRKARASD